MTIEYLNNKLYDFLEKKELKNISEKINKTAALGNFSDIKDPSEITKAAAMTNEMLDLPKYQPIINQLKGSIGIVNFVTNDEYQPLIELLLQRAFPLSNNDIFSMGEQESYGDGFFVSNEFFGGKDVIQGHPPHVLAARDKLEDLLLGSQTKITRQWLKEKQGFTDEEIFAMLGSPKIDETIANEMAGGQGSGQPPNVNRLGLAVTLYEMGLDAISKKYDPYIKELNKQIFEHNMGEKVLSKEDLQKKKNQRNIWISQKREELATLNNTRGRAITVKQWYPEKVYRNNDGFINYEPEDSVIKSSIELLKQMSKLSGDALAKSILNLKTKLEDYYSSNPKISKIQGQFLSFLGNVTPDDCKRVKDNSLGFYVQLCNAFRNAVNSQGKVLILDDFDKSALCNRASPHEGAIKMDDLTRNIFLDFVGKNDSNLERDDSAEKQDKGNRILVIVSSERISNLPSSSIVEMNVAPVDNEEAEIIVKHIIKQYKSMMYKSLRVKLHRQIDEKYQKPNVDMSKKGFEKEIITEQLESQKDNLCNISEDTQRRMVNNIIGLGQKEAVNVIRVALRYGLKTDETDVLSPEKSFDEKEILTSLRKTVNDTLSKGVMGLRIVEPEVEFEDYAYNRTSGWANRVIAIKDVRDELVDLKECIKLNTNRINEIDRDIKISAKLPSNDPKKLDADDIAVLMKERQGLVNQNTNYRLQTRSISANDIPHIYILYGRPGTGKSIWAHALASLLKINIKSVDIGAQKDMWLGNTEKHCRQLFSTMINSRDTIYLIDELDKQVEQGRGQSASTHETTKNLVSMFLELFENTENENKFRQNNTFFIMTTNEIEDINTALMQRVSDTYKVELPDHPEDYEKFFRSYIKVEKGRFPEDPWFCDVDDTTTEDCWTSTMGLLNSLDWKSISIEFANKQIDFRSLKKMLQQSFNQHREWRTRIKMIGKGKTVEPRGMPLTTQNMLAIAKIIETGAESNDSFKLGVGALATQKAEEARKALMPYIENKEKLQTEKFVDPLTGKEEMRYKLPDNVMNIMNGTVVEEEQAPDYDYTREVDPSTGKVKTNLKPKETPSKIMDDLGSSGFVEKPIDVPDASLVEPQKGMPQDKSKKEDKKDEKKENKKDDNKKEEIKSSTDYFYDVLLKNGILNPDGSLSSPKDKNIKNAQVTPSNMPQNIPPQTKPAGSGVYNFGFIMIAPGNAKTPPQYIKTELEKEQKGVI